MERVATARPRFPAADARTGAAGTGRKPAMMLSDGEQHLVPRRIITITCNYHQPHTSNMLPLLQLVILKHHTPTSSMFIGTTEKTYPFAFDRPMPLRGPARARDLQKALAHLGSLQARDERGATLLLNQHGAARGELFLILVHPPLDGILNVCACAPCVIRSCILF